jgi:hypothetical protein
MRRSFLFILLAIFVPFLSWAQLSLEDELIFSVMGIEGKSHKERNEFIKNQLQAIGVGYVRSAFATIDTPIFIKVRDKLLQAKVAKMPFS